MILAAILATIANPNITVPGGSSDWIKVTTHVVVMRDWRAISYEPNELVTLNAPGSFERVQVYSPFGGLICTQQNSPPPLLLHLAEADTVYVGCATYEFESSQITLVNRREYAAPEVNLHVDFLQQFYTQFHSGAALVQESSHISAYVTVEYL